MTDYPRTRALLAALCGLDEMDAQLPLLMVANIHRGVLRQPLLGMVPIREAYILSEEYAADKRAVQGTGLFVASFRAVLLERYQLDWKPCMLDLRVDAMKETVDDDACTTLRKQETGLVRQLLNEVALDWQAYEALALLYYVGQGLPFESVLPAVELFLELVPNLHAFAVARAQAAQAAARPVQSE